MSAIKRYLEDKACELSDLYNIDEAIFYDILPKLDGFIGNEDEFRFALCNDEIEYLDTLKQIDGNYEVFQDSETPTDAYPCIVVWREIESGDRGEYPSYGDAYVPGDD